MAIGPDNKAYWVVPQEDGTFAVKISALTELPRIVEGFLSEQEAQDWVFQRITTPELQFNAG